MRTEEADRSTRDQQADTPPAAERPRVSSEKLFSGARRMIIEHNGANYILQITRAGKLILTK